jgi:hypothetical protein
MHLIQHFGSDFFTSLYEAKLTPLYSDALLSFYFLFTMFGELCNRHSVLPQLAVTCIIEAECSYQTFVLGDSEVLQNRQLRQHAKRWQC